MTRATDDLVSLRIRGVDDDTRDYVHAQVSDALLSASVPVHDATLVVDVAGGVPGLRAKARVALGGCVIRAHAAGADTKEAVEHATQRLRRQLAVVRERPRVAPLGGRGRRPARWEFGDAPTHRPPFVPKPVTERELVRQKPYDRTLRTPESALTQASLLDYDFFLFVDGRSRTPAVVRRDGIRWQL